MITEYENIPYNDPSCPNRFHFDTADLGPWILHRGKVADRARETAIAKFLNRRLHGEDPPPPAPGSAYMERFYRFRDEALGMAEEHFGVALARSVWIANASTGLTVRPDGWNSPGQLAVSVRTPFGPHQVSRTLHGFDGDEEFEALCRLEASGAATWVVMSMSPPYPALNTVFARADYEAELEELRVALQDLRALSQQRLAEFEQRVAACSGAGPITV